MADYTDVIASLLGGGLAVPPGQGASAFSLPPISGATSFALPAIGGGGASFGLPAVGGGSAFDLPAVGGGSAFELPSVASGATGYPLGAVRDQRKEQAAALEAANKKAVKVPGRSGGPAPADVPAEYRPTLEQAASQYGVDPTLLAAQLKQESNFSPTARSPAGAQGVAQFMPGTAAQYGVDVNDPHSSIRGQAHYMADLLKQYNGDQTLALVAYNGGGAAVAAWQAGRPFAESTAYVNRVTANQQAYRAQNTAAAASAIAPGTVVPNPAGQAFLANAMSYQGVPYVWGGSTRAGVDCSGLIIAAARDSGHPLQGRPTAQGIYNQTPFVPPADVLPGDLVFFEGTAGANAGERISHVGIVTEQGMMLNAPSPGKTVTVAPYNSAFWAPKIVGFGRLPQ